MVPTARGPRELTVVCPRDRGRGAQPDALMTPIPICHAEAGARQLIGDSGGVPLVLQEQVRRDLRPQPLLLAVLVDEVPNGRELHPVAA